MAFIEYYFKGVFKMNTNSIENGKLEELTNGYQILLHTFYTKEDKTGEVYYTVRITNPKNGKSFITKAVHLSNIEWVLYDFFHGPFKAYYSDSCINSVDSKKMQSDYNLHYNELTPNWITAMTSIGFSY